MNNNLVDVKSMSNEDIMKAIGQDDGRIERATITSNGKFCSSYQYLVNYINSK